MAINRLPDVGRIQGIRATSASRPELSRISIQFEDEKHQLHELDLRALDALYLLNLIEQWAKNAGIEHLRHPPVS